MQAIQALVISLPGSSDRQEKARLELAQTDLNWRFLDAIRGSALTTLPAEYQPKKVKRLLGFELTSSELGCFLSHKKAWQVCVADNIPTIIFEDDFRLLPHFEKTISYLMQDYTDWGAVRLQGIHPVAHDAVDSFGDIKLVKNKADAVGSSAYILKPAQAKLLIEGAVDIYEPLDHFLEHHSVHHVDFLAIHPYPVGTTGDESTILDRPGRLPIKGIAKLKRSLARSADRFFSSKPWFPK
jgi:glycosyl transferase, family 25